MSSIIAKKRTFAGGFEKLLIYEGLILMLIGFVSVAGSDIGLPYGGNWASGFLFSFMGIILSLVGLRLPVVPNLGPIERESHSLGYSFAHSVFYLEYASVKSANKAFAFVMSAVGIVFFGISGPFWLIFCFLGCFNDFLAYMTNGFVSPLSLGGISFILTAYLMNRKPRVWLGLGL